jgi:hypothetical protein
LRLVPCILDDEVHQGASDALRESPRGGWFLTERRWFRPTSHGAACDLSWASNGFQWLYDEVAQRVRLTVTPVAVLRGDSNVKGTVTFEQASEGAETTISWNVTGNDANAERGMHIHTFGDNTNGCTSAGPHCMSRMTQQPRIGQD